MKIIGITGGVGSGKSRILNILKEETSSYIIESDKLAHFLMQPGMSVYNGIVEEFGTTILGPDMTIDRKKLGDIVFNDSKKLEILNEITHPKVKESILADIEKHKNLMDVDYFIIEAALLIQDGYKEICDEIWFIQVNKDIRIKRLMEQRGYTVEKCMEIFDSQPDDMYFVENSDYVVNNNGDFEETYREIMSIIS